MSRLTVRRSRRTTARHRATATAVMDEDRGLRARSPGEPDLDRTNALCRDTRKLGVEDRNMLRIRAVRSLEAGRSQKEVAEALHVSRQAVNNWARIIREKGPAALKAGRKGRPKSRPLQPWQEARIASAIVLLPPAMMGLPFRSWTRKAISQLVEQSFGLRLSTYMVGSYLKRWGFEPRRSVRFRFARTSPRLLEWLEEEGQPGTMPGIQAGTSGAEVAAAG